jgi:hypothetical protein
MESIGSFAAGGVRIGPVDPVWVFLGPGGLAAKTLDYNSWKRLDFLGFSRPNLVFSMGYAGFSLQ